MGELEGTERAKSTQVSQSQDLSRLMCRKSSGMMKGITRSKPTLRRPPGEAFEQVFPCSGPFVERAWKNSHREGRREDNGKDFSDRRDRGTGTRGCF